MGDLKSFWTDPGMPESESLVGDDIGASGGDPNITDGQAETANSVSGLPLLPSRMVSNEAPPPPPSLEDRNPGTIDQQ